MRRRAVFLDREGSLLDGFPRSPDAHEIHLAPGVTEAALALQESGFLLVVVSTQPGLALGHVDEKDFAHALFRLDGLLRHRGVRIASYHYCPHHPAGRVRNLAVACGCRRPNPQLLHDAAVRHGIDLSRSWVIGDLLHDIEAAHRAGCRGVLIDNGTEIEWALSARRRPDIVARDILEAASWILAIDRLEALPRAIGATRMTFETTLRRL
jgi:histidinol-phosphate phosphatase family protein